MSTQTGSIHCLVGTPRPDGKLARLKAFIREGTKTGRRLIVITNEYHREYESGRLVFESRLAADKTSPEPHRSVSFYAVD